MSDPNDIPQDLLDELVKEGLIAVTPDEPVAEAPVVDEVAVEAAPVVAEVPATPAVETPAEPFEGYAALPEAARKFIDDQRAAASKAEELEQRARNAERDRLAVQGRLAPAQRELEAARKRLQEIDEAQRKNTSSVAREKLDKFKEQYPDEAAPLDAVYGEFRAEIEQLRKDREETAQQMAQLRHQAYLADAKAQLTNIHPDWSDLENGSESDQFYAWLDLAPSNKKLLELGGVENTAAVVTNYKREKELARLYTQGGQSEAAPTPATKPLARAVADPNPVLRKTTGISRSGTASTSDEEENYANVVAEMRAAGIPL